MTVAVGGRAGDGCAVAGQPTTEPDPQLSAPSWQLLLNLPFIACQKRPGCFALPPPPPRPLILTFIILRAVPALPLRVRHRRVGGRELSRAQALPGGSALPPTWQILTPNILRAARGGRQLGEQRVNPRGCGRCPLESSRMGAAQGRTSGPAGGVLPARQRHQVV